MSTSSGDIDSNDSENINDVDIIGNILNGKYFIIKKIGYGGYSKIYLSYNLIKKNGCAIKIHSNSNENVGIIEKKILCKLIKNKNVITYYDSFIYDDDFFCIVYELMTCSTYDLMKYYYKSGLEYSLVKKIANVIINVMVKMHEIGYIHGDIKPENILIKIKNDYFSNIINKIKCNYKNISKMPIEKRLFIINYVIDETKNFKCCNSTNSSSTYSSNDNNNSIFDDNEIDYIYSKSDFKDGINKSNDENNTIYNFKYINDDICQNNEHTICKYFEIENTDDIYIKIIDFGLSKKISKLNIFDNIQTRYYRAPEVILGNKYNEKIDIWSYGCTIFELLTNTILFNPNKNELIGRNRFHVYLIYKIIGKFPNNMISLGCKSDIFFNNQNKLKYDKYIDDNIDDLKKMLYNKLKKYDENDINMIYNHIKYILNIDYIKRPKAIDCILL
jgi:serine/threonine-protein kinase SRPK3